MPHHPNKKPKLADSFDEWDEDAFGNEDLWGQGELTAEEFDILEIQATQKVVPSASTNNPIITNNCNHSSCVQDSDDHLKEQYALQGQVKLLTESLQKTVHELNSERLSREQIIAQKLKEAKDVECRLQKDIERLQTAFQFKEQEMKTSLSKIHSLEQKTKELINSKEAASHQQPSTSTKNDPDGFLNRFQFNKHCPKKDSSVQVGAKSGEISSHHKLSLLFFQGELENHNMISSFLTNRRKLLTLSKENSFPGQFSSNAIPFLPLALFNSGNKCHELSLYYDAVLKEHLSFLQKVASLTRGRTCSLNRMKLPRSTKDVSSSSAEPSTLGEVIEIQHSTIISCLKDLHQLCLPLNDGIHVFNVQHKNMKILKCITEPETSACSSSLFPEDEKVDSSEETNSSCMQSLILLANPQTYPECYYYRQDEMHAVLSTLIEWSTRMDKGLDMFVYNLPFQALMSGAHGTKCALLALRVLLNLIFLESFKFLIHKNDSCIISCVANLCQSVSSADKKDYVEAVSAIESFIGGCSAVPEIDIFTHENCSCVVQLTQGYVIMLWRYHDMCHKALYSSPMQVDLLQRGIALLHVMSTTVLNFRDKRSPVEDQYITLVCGLSKFCEENSQFKNMIDVIHDLWDFQDMSDEADEPMID